MSTAANMNYLDGGTAAQLRGDPITGDRYYSTEFMQREWDHMWTRIWHMGAHLAEIPEPGDYTVHDFRQESVITIRQADGSVRAFYNTCRHRGMRLAWAEEGSSDGFVCAYHGWAWGVDGVLRDVQDVDDFETGNPCGKLTLSELRCETWGGFAWWNMDEGAPALLDYLDPIPTLFENRGMEDMVRVMWRTFSVDTNWKFASDNFNESYHLPSVHPQLRANIDEDFANTIFEMYPSGHNRMIEMGQPSLRADRPNEVESPYDLMLAEWDLDPKDFAGRAREGRIALQKQKRKLWKEKGYHHLEHYGDAELTDPHHHTLFPNVTLTAGPEGVSVFRTEPHLTDPNKCTFDYFFLVPKVEGKDIAGTIVGPRPMVPAAHEKFDYGAGEDVDLSDMEGSFLIQDLSVAVGQQRGLSSRGYTDAHLTGQETRVRRFHEVLNDYLEGRR